MSAAARVRGDTARSIGSVDVVSRLIEPRLAVPCLVAVALALRLPNLGESLWLDEVVYSTHFQIDSLDGLRRFLMESPPAPLYVILAHYWVAIAGDHELLVRLPSLVFGLGSVVLTYHVARKFGGDRMALLAGLVLCLSPAHVWYSQEATPYAMSMFLLLATVLVWFRLETSPDASQYTMYFVLLLAAVLTHYFILVFLVPLSLSSLGLHTRQRSRILLAHAGVALCCLAVIGIKYVGGVLASPGGFLRPFTIFEWWMLFFNWFLHGNSIWTVRPYIATWDYLRGEPMLVALQVACALVLVRGLWAGREHRRGLMAHLELALLLCALPAALLVLTIAGYRDVYIERYAIVALPFFAIALARGVSRCSTAWVRYVLACALVAIGIGSYAMLLGKSTVWTVYKQNSDVRAAAEFVRAHSPRPREVAVVSMPMSPELGYYVRKAMPDESMDVMPYSAAAVEDVLGMPRIRTVLVANLQPGSNFDGVLDAFRQDPRVHLTATRSFTGVDVLVFALRRGPLRNPNAP